MNLRISIWLGLVLLAANAASATPVYLNVDSRFPSGQYARQVLEVRTKKTQLQHWLRVETRDHAFGWISEDELLTPLRLAAEAEVTLKVLSPRAAFASQRQELLPPGSHVQILEVTGSFAHVHQIGHTKEASYWLPTSALRASVASAHAVRPDGGGEKAFLPRDTPIFILPGAHARVQFEARASSFFSIVKQDRIWIEIRTPGGNAFLRRADAILLEDLIEGGTQAVRPLADLTAMRTAPIPYANVVRNLAAGTPLNVLGQQNLRWGQAHIREIGDVWWPMNDMSFAFGDDSEGFGGGAKDPGDERSRERLTSAALFKRKLFDMAASPSTPALKFASAGGIFRTSDGNQWVRLPFFKNQNFPIAIAGGGSIFIGQYVSEDQGDTFQEWIRWDSLFAALGKTIRGVARPTPGSLQIQEIRPEGPSGRRVMVKLTVGHDATVKVVTTDQGLNWSAL